MNTSYKFGDILKTLSSPLKRHLMGAKPPYSSRKELHTHFNGVSKEIVTLSLEANGLLSDEGKVTQKAADEEYVAICEKKALWDVEKVKGLLELGGMKVSRVAKNQEVEIPVGDPVWANLGTISTYFSVTANQVGKWLDELGLRDEGGTPSEESVKGGLATLVEMNAGGKKTRSVAHWNLHVIKAKLVEAGYELDFNYEESMKGKGRNSDVEVTGLDKRAQEVFIEWKTLYQSPKTRQSSWDIFKRQPTAIIVKIEAMLGKPRFIQDKRYLNLR